MDKKKTIEMIAKNDRDTKRTHRFLLESENGVAGSIYISKETRPLPKEVILKLKTKGDR